MGIFFNKIRIQNYKCFDDCEINLNIPNGNIGSGLNILIGENGTGKTSILESINYLTLNSFSVENRLNINDFKDFQNVITIESYTDEFKCNSSISFYSTYYFKSNGIKFSAKCRERKSPGKVLSSQFTTSNNFIVCNESYYKKDNNNVIIGKDSNEKNIDARDKMFDNERIMNDEEVNVFYLDKNRSRQLFLGNYKTTFEKICDELNWKFIHNIDEHKREELVNILNDGYFKLVNEVIKSTFGQKTSEKIVKYLDDPKYKNLKIEYLNILQPFKNAFMALREDCKLNQIDLKNLGSGIEMFAAMMLIKNISDQSKGSIIYLIDEPELHLHPKIQDNLIKLLYEESKSIQIIITTHSPFIYKDYINDNVNMLLFEKSGSNIKIANAKDKERCLFPWSPTWGEINYFIFDMPTVEFHNELYGYIQEKEKKFSDKDIESYFLSKSILCTKTYIQEKNGNPMPPKKISLMTYIRHQIHHPENKRNTQFTPEEQRESIETMVKLIK